MKPAINPKSEKLITAIAKNLPQSLLITGDSGVGLSEIAKYISELNLIEPLVILPEKDEIIDIEKGVIGVDIIRRLFDQTRSKSTGKRITIIDFAEKMTVQAQNAFLKLLEEPNANTYFILVSSSQTKLLPTILSRTEKIIIRTITLEQSNRLLDDLGVNDKLKRSQLLFMAEGMPSELIRLCQDAPYFEKRSTIVRDAREFLSADTYHKLLIANKYKEDRVLCLNLLNDASSILKRSIVDNPQPASLKLVESLVDAYKQIEANGNIRLCLARIVV